MQPTRDSNGAGRTSSLLGLAPAGGCLAAGIAAGAGGLLHHLFTMTRLRGLPVSVALPAGCPGSGKERKPGSPPRELPGALPYGVRTFLSGLPRRGRPAGPISGIILDPKRAVNSLVSC